MLLGNVSGRSTSVRIRENDSNNRPGNLVATLTNPGNFTGNSLNTFTAPAGTTLAANTTYWITVNEGITGNANRVFVSIGFSNVETGEPGWRIGDNRLWKNSESNPWSTPPATSSLLIAIKGTVLLSTDATLSGLVLVDVDGNAGALDPTFESNTTNYTASVPNSTDSVTLTATKNDSNATVDITDDDDTSTPNEAELSLNVGSNTLTVTVTAEDGSTTQTYTVTVTRAVEPGRVLVSRKVLTVTEGTVG